MDFEMLKSIKLCIENQTKRMETRMKENPDEGNGSSLIALAFPPFSSGEDWEEYHLRLDQHFRAYNIHEPDKV